MRRLGLWTVVGVATLSSVACSADPGPPAPQAGTDRSSLANSPLRLPRLTPGETCPRSPLHTTSPDFGPGLGDGPAYPLGFTAEGELHVQLPPFEPEHQWSGSGWGGQKVLWVIDPDYTGPIRIRGGRLDAAGEIRFDNELVREIRLSEEKVFGWRERPSLTRLRAPGCYAYQVDGRGFRDVIVFDAVPVIEECTSGAVRRLVRSFVRAFNAGNERRLDLLLAAEPEFRSYSVDGPRGGPREASGRETLLPYFSTRHALGERLELKSFRFSGNTRGYGHFQYRLRRGADDLAPADYLGKGAALCTVYGEIIAVWSMGPER